MKAKDLPKLQENVPLARFTTFRLGGPARYLIEAKTREELIAALDWAREKKIRHLVIGDGSNILFLDSGFDGLVVKNSTAGFKVAGDKIVADSGVALHVVVAEACRRGLAGLESLSWIPGSVGGAIYGNAGAYGQEIGRVIASVDIYEAGQAKSLSAKQCKFSYRDSVFKSMPGVIVLGATIKLSAAGSAALASKCETIKQERQKKLPGEPSAGSVFQNILAGVAKENPKLQPFLAKAKGGKIAAGLLIDQAGLKGQKIGGALVSPRHANFIVNTGTATADDVIKLISLIKARVRDMFGVNLECEVQIIK